MNANERQWILREMTHQKMETHGFQPISLFAFIRVYSRPFAVKKKGATTNERE